jgi:hypothetical protein
LRDLHDNTRSKRSAAIRRRGAVSPASVCSQSSRFMPTTSRFSPCRQMISSGLHAGILHMRGNHRKVIGIERDQFELRRHRILFCEYLINR